MIWIVRLRYRLETFSICWRIHRKTKIRDDEEISIRFNDGKGEGADDCLLEFSVNITDLHNALADYWGRRDAGLIKDSSNS